MHFSVLAIIFVSTLMHVGWNLMTRHGRSEPQFIRKMLIAGSVLGLGPVLVWEIVDPLGPRIWMLLSVSGTFCAIYFAGLAKGYTASDFTIVYPVVRALPVLLVGLADMFLGRWPTPLGWAGMMLVVIGCTLTPLTTLRSFNLRVYLNPASLWVVLAALGTVGYSLVDKVSADILRETFGSGPVVALRYSVMFFVVATIVYELFVRFAGWQLIESRPPHALSSRQIRFQIHPLFAVKNLASIIQHPTRWAPPTLAALMNIVSYGLIVWVLQLTRQVSYVVAFRQFSIVIGVIAAIILFHEPGRIVRLIAALLITVGLVVIGVWGG